MWIINFFQIFTFIGYSVICLSLSEIPIWTHQREFGLRTRHEEFFKNGSCNIISVVPSLSNTNMDAMTMRPRMYSRRSMLLCKQKHKKYKGRVSRDEQFFKYGSCNITVQYISTFFEKMLIYCCWFL